MKMIKKWQLLTLVLINAVTFNACSNAPAESSNAQTKNDVQHKTENTQQQSVQKGESPIQAALDKAKNAGKAIFVVVTGTGKTNVDKAMDIAKGANEIYKNAVIVEMNRDDAANAELVKEWRLSGAPLPLILVVSSKGTLIGGRILAQANAENIASLVPSPKKEEVLSYLNSGKSVFLVVSNSKIDNNKSPVSACEKACIEMQQKAQIVSVNTDDLNEVDFLKELKINPNIKESKTYVINARGQITGSFNSDVTPSTLVASAKKVITSCCGPGKSCGPAK